MLKWVVPLHPSDDLTLHIKVLEFEFRNETGHMNVWVNVY